MKIKTSDLIGPALDWTVAKCEGVEYRWMASSGGDYNGNWWWKTRSYSTDWSQGGPIIEREKISVIPFDDRWEARCACTPHRSVAQFIERRGPTPLIAAMRCFVASKLGDEVDIPEELLR